MSSFGTSTRSIPAGRRQPVAKRPRRSARQAHTIALRDPASAISHFIGAVAALTSTPFLLVHAAQTGAGTRVIVGCAVFVLSMVLLYTASTLHHSLMVTGKAYRRFRKFDHMMVYVLIAGTYTPICLTVLLPTVGTWLLALIWAIGLAGMLFNACWITCPKWLSSVLYIAMGWLCMVALPELLGAVGPAGLAWLLAGGILYTAGGCFYALKLKGFNERHPMFGSHEVFHLFVLAGTVCHYVFVYHVLL